MWLNLTDSIIQTEFSVFIRKTIGTVFFPGVNKWNNSIVSTGTKSVYVPAKHLRNSLSKWNSSYVCPESIKLYLRFYNTNGLVVLSVAVYETVLSIRAYNTYGNNIFTYQCKFTLFFLFNPERTSRDNTVILKHYPVVARFQR